MRKENHLSNRPENRHRPEPDRNSHRYRVLHLPASKGVVHSTDGFSSAWNGMCLEDDDWGGQIIVSTKGHGGDTSELTVRESSRELERRSIARSEDRSRDAPGWRVARGASYESNANQVFPWKKRIAMKGQASSCRRVADPPQTYQGRWGANIR